MSQSQTFGRRPPLRDPPEVLSWLERADVATLGNTATNPRAGGIAAKVGLAQELGLRRREC